MLGRIDEHHAILVVEPPVAFDGDDEVTAVLEREPRAAIGQDVGVHRRRGVERRAHALARVAVPRTFLPSDVDACQAPDLELGEVRAAAIAPRDKRRPCLLYLPEGDGHVLRALHMSGVGLGADEHEIVVHDVVALDPLPFGHELLFQRFRMHQHHVRIAAPADIERLARAHGDHPHLDAGFPLEYRQQVLEEPGLFRRSRRSDGNEAGQRRGECYTHGNSPFMNAAASAVAGRAKNCSIGARSMTRPACR